MARFLSKTLFRDPSFSCIMTRSPALKLKGVRLQSGRPEAACVVVVDAEAGAEPNTVEAEVLSLRRLDDAIQSFVVKQSAPGWLPFAPGASYWVPPISRSLGEVDLADRLCNPLSEELHLRPAYREWPCSSYFLNGAIPHHSIKLWTKDFCESQSDDDED